MLGMCNSLLGVGPLWLRLPPPHGRWKRASTSKDPPPTIIRKSILPLPLIPNEGPPGEMRVWPEYCVTVGWSPWPVSYPLGHQTVLAVF